MPHDAVPQNGNPHLPEAVCKGIADALYSVADWDEPALGHGPHVKYFKGQAGRVPEGRSKGSSPSASSLRTRTGGSIRMVPGQERKSAGQSPSGSSPRSLPRRSRCEGTDQKGDVKSANTSRSSLRDTKRGRIAIERNESG